MSVKKLKLWVVFILFIMLLIVVMYSIKVDRYVIGLLFNGLRKCFIVFLVVIWKMLLLVKFFEIDFVFEVDVLELCFDGICNLSFKLRLCLGLSNDFFFIYGLINEFLFFLFVSVLIRLCSFFVFR